jgi:hypothetical protein
VSFLFAGNDICGSGLYQPFTEARLYLVGGRESGNSQGLGIGGVVENIIDKQVDLGVVKQGIWEFGSPIKRPLVNE